MSQPWKTLRVKEPVHNEAVELYHAGKFDTIEQAVAEGLKLLREKITKQSSRLPKSKAA